MKKVVPFLFYLTLNRKLKKIAKILKNTIMDSFQAKIGCNSPRKRENKNYCSVPFKPDP